MARNNQDSSGRQLRRKVATRKPRKTLLVFCEGERTEPEYLNALKRQPRVRDVAAVDLRVEAGRGGSVPQALVSMAADARTRAMDEEAEIDEFWCVFDVEWPKNHPGLKDAIERARQNGVQLAVSNPCFELWLILHFQDCGAWLNNDHARRLRRELDGAGDKGIDAAKYMPRTGAAAYRAAALESRHLRNQTPFPDDNPSSGMHRLLATVELDVP
jgi:hypothetical protein